MLTHLHEDEDNLMKIELEEPTKSDMDSDFIAEKIRKYQKPAKDPVVASTTPRNILPRVPQQRACCYVGPETIDGPKSEYPDVRRDPLRTLADVTVDHTHAAVLAPVHVTQIIQTGPHARVLGQGMQMGLH